MLTPTSSPHSVRRAFTLIELLAVIAVIGILAGILVTAIGNVRESARASSSVSNLRQLATASQLFVNENGYFPGGEHGFWWIDVQRFAEPLVNFRDSGGNTVWFSPSLVAQHGNNIGDANIASYSMNRWLNTQAGAASNRVKIRPTQIEYPNRKALFLESVFVPPSSFTIEAAHYIYNAYRSATPLNERDLHVVFVDGHVQKASIESILTKKNPHDETPFWGVIARE